MLTQDQLYDLNYILEAAASSLAKRGDTKDKLCIVPELKRLHPIVTKAFEHAAGHDR